MSSRFLCLLALSSLGQAHTVAWTKGMYCQNGTGNVDDPNTNTPVGPLYQLSKSDWWFQHDRGCDAKPPEDGDVLSLPANGSFTVELAHNRAFTTLSYDGTLTSVWPDGKDYPEDRNGAPTGEGCIQDDGALHTHNESTAAGTAFAISYVSELADVTMENLVVFTTLQQYVVLSAPAPTDLADNITARHGSVSQHMRFPISRNARQEDVSVLGFG